MNQMSAKAQRLAELKSELLCVEGTPTEVYSRIVGYYRSVRNWNAGKRHEYTRRRTYQLDWSDRPAASSPTQAASAAAQDTDALAQAVGSPAQAAVGELTKAYLLFTRKACPNCGPVRDLFVQKGLEPTIVDVDTDDGLAAARHYNVMATPTAILLADSGREQARAYDRRQLAAYLDRQGQSVPLGL